MSEIKVYGSTSNPRFSKVAITAKYSGIEIETVEGFTLGKDNKTEEFLKKFPLGQAPAMELADGNTLTESSAISLYVAEQKENNPLVGQNALERAQILKYQSLGESQICLNLLNILYPSWGMLPYEPKREEVAYSKLESIFAELDATLASKKFLVGDRMTIADIEIICNLVFAYEFIMYPEIKDKFPNLLSYHERLSQEKFFQEHFKSRTDKGYPKEKLVIKA